MWTSRLDAATADAVRALAARATRADGVSPLNEDATFALTDDSAHHLVAGLPVSTPGAPAAVGTESGAPPGERDSDRSGAAGYLQWQPRFGTAQLVVDPDHRRRGIGTALLGQLAERTAPHLWAFGNLPAARGFADARSLAPVRGLLMMTAPLAGTTPPVIPDGVTLRGYTGADADALLDANAAAFAHHPEQGALDAAGLATRMSEPWFDPDGLILAFDEAGLAGFHWTKAEAGVGEVYVVGVHPRAQGRGYGKLLLQAGMSHLAAKGLPIVELYVDAADQIAVRMYERAGFTEAHRDVLYASTPQE